jgi:hypothetical protein
MNSAQEQKRKVEKAKRSWSNKRKTLELVRICSRASFPNAVAI